MCMLERYETTMFEKAKKLGVVCFWTALIIELIIVLIDKSAYINPYEGILFRITFVLFGLKLITTKYSRKQWICIVIVGLIAAVSYFVNTRDEAVRAVVFVAACKDIDLKKLLKIVLGITFAGSLLLFVLSATGIFGALSMTANFGRGPSPGIVETRYCFGMGHPNAFQCMLFMMSTLVLYIYSEKMKIWHFVILGLVNILAYMYTDSNTSLLVMMLTLAGVVLLKYVKLLRENKIIYILGAAAVLVIVLFSVYGSHVGTENQIMYKLDKLLNGRFQYAHLIENARMENWTLFAYSENKEYFDQGFIRLFYWYGIIPAVICIASMIYLVWQSYKNKDYTLLVIIVGYSVFSIMEAHIVSVYLLRNYLLIWMGYYWYRR